VTLSSCLCFCVTVPWPPRELFTRCLECELAATAGRSETCVWVSGLPVVPTLNCAPHAKTCDAVFALFLFLSFSLSLSLSQSRMMYCGHTYRANRTMRLTHFNTGRSARTRPSLNTYHTAPSYLSSATHTYTHTRLQPCTVNSQLRIQPWENCSAHICIYSVAGSVFAMLCPVQTKFGHGLTFISKLFEIVVTILVIVFC